METLSAWQSFSVIAKQSTRSTSLPMFDPRMQSSSASFNVQSSDPVNLIVQNDSPLDFVVRPFFFVRDFFDMWPCLLWREGTHHADPRGQEVNVRAVDG